MTATLSPCPDKVSAQVLPAGPAPTMITSKYLAVELMVLFLFSRANLRRFNEPFNKEYWDFGPHRIRHPTEILRR